MAKAKDGELCPICQTPIRLGDTKPLRNNNDILPYLDHFRDKKQEFFICLSLDSGRRLIDRRVVTIGLLDATLAHPREVFAGPLVDRAAAVIVAHNHPSGDASPSRQDIEMTQQLIAAGQLLGVPLRDHIIITTKGHYSFLCNGLL
jgi:DNA repair protein RadC